MDVIEHTPPRMIQSPSNTAMMAQPPSNLEFEFEDIYDTAPIISESVDSPNITMSSNPLNVKSSPSLNTFQSTSLLDKTATKPKTHNTSQLVPTHTPTNIPNIEGDRDQYKNVKNFDLYYESIKTPEMDNEHKKQVHPIIKEDFKKEQSKKERERLKEAKQLKELQNIPEPTLGQIKLQKDLEFYQNDKAELKYFGVKGYVKDHYRTDLDKLINFRETNPKEVVSKTSHPELWNLYKKYFYVSKQNGSVGNSIGASTLSTKAKGIRLDVKRQFKAFDSPAPAPRAQSVIQSRVVTINDLPTNEKARSQSVYQSRQNN